MRSSRGRVREGVTNVIRHSGATRCTVRLTAERVEVLDNGAGAHRRRCRHDHGGHGLAGLRERATARAHAPHQSR